MDLTHQHRISATRLERECDLKLVHIKRKTRSKALPKEQNTSACVAGMYGIHHGAGAVDGEYISVGNFVERLANWLDVDRVEKLGFI
ncbi:hypothetical protein MLD38_014398 [Melastoma candidum]|uniref:Uncharacterized protein n=1 Tax=Melastoma candidum TaxID=119954 RepID=A0ACB9RCM3_9MYRT|nr:hypothetical protein MLD38_014398 [Melastoma candidum]